MKLPKTIYTEDFWSGVIVGLIITLIILATLYFSIDEIV